MVNGVVALAVSFEGDGRVGPDLLEVAVARSEMIVQRAFFPNSVLLAAF